MSRLLKTRRGHDSEDDYSDSDDETYNTTDMNESSIRSLSEADQSDFDYESTDKEYTETETETGTKTETDSETDSEEDNEDEQPQQVPILDRQVIQDSSSNVTTLNTDGSLTPTNNNNILVQVDEVSTDSNTPKVDETLSKAEETHVDNNNTIVEEIDYEATKEKRIQEHREYRRKLAEDPSFVPYVGLFWSHDDRYRDDAFSETRTEKSSTDTSIPHFTSVQQSRVHSDRNTDPLMYKKWDHSGYEELCKLDEEEEKLKRIAIENGQDVDKVLQQKRHVEKERGNRGNYGQRYQHFNNHYRNRNYQPRQQQKVGEEWPELSNNHTLTTPTMVENHAWATATPELLHEHDKVSTSILVDVSTHDNEPVTKKDKSPWDTTTNKLEAVSAWGSVNREEEIVTLKDSTPDIKVPSSDGWGNVEEDVAATGWGNTKVDLAPTGWGNSDITPESKPKTGILVDIHDTPVEKTVDSTSKSNWSDVNKLNTEVSKTTWGNAKKDNNTSETQQDTTNTAHTWETPKKATTTTNSSWETPKEDTTNSKNQETSNWGTIDQSVALDNNCSDNTNTMELNKETTDASGVTHVTVKWDDWNKSTPVDTGCNSSKKTEEPVADQFQNAESEIGTPDIPTTEKASSSWAELSANAEPERVYERRTERPFYSRARNNYEDNNNRHSNHVGYYKQNYQHNRSPLHKSLQPKESWSPASAQTKEWTDNTSNNQFKSPKDRRNNTPGASGWGETPAETTLSWDSKKPQVDSNNSSNQWETPSTPATTASASASGWGVPATSNETSTASGRENSTTANESSTTTFGWGSSTTTAGKTANSSEREAPTAVTPTETPTTIKLTAAPPVAEALSVTAPPAISKASPVVSKSSPAITTTSPALAKTSSTASPVPAEATTTTGWGSSPAPTETAASGWSTSPVTVEVSNTEWSESPTPAKSSAATESHTVSGWGGSAATKYSSSGWGKSSNYKKPISSPVKSTTPVESYTSPENSGPEESSTSGWGSLSRRETAFRRSANTTNSGWATTDEQPTTTRQNGRGNSDSDNWNADKKARINRQLKDQPRRGRGYLSQKLETTPSPIEVEQYQDKGDSDSDVEIILEADEEPDWVKNEQILGMTAPGEDSSSEAAVPEKSRYNYSQSYDHSNLQHTEQVSYRNIAKTQRKPKRNFDDNWRQRDDVSSDNENRPSIPMHYPQPHHPPHMNTYLPMIPNGANGAPMYTMPFPMGIPTSSSPIAGSTSPINSIGGSDSSPHISNNNVKYYPQLPPPMMNGPNGFQLPPGYEANGMVYYGVDPSAMYAPQPAPFYYYGPPMPDNGSMISPQQRLSPNHQRIMDDDLAEDGWGPSPDVQDGEEQWSSSHNNKSSPNNYHNSSAYYIYSHPQ